MRLGESSPRTGIENLYRPRAVVRPFSPRKACSSNTRLERKVATFRNNRNKEPAKAVLVVHDMG